jgi:predicted MFS family arabinose efflux permease
METLTSPILAAGLLSIISFHWLFAGTALGFLGSAALVISAVLPSAKSQIHENLGIYTKTTRGIRVYLKTPRLRGLFAVTLAAAAASAMVIVNTVVLVRSLGADFGQQDVALTLAAFGGGSMLAAFSLPRILDRIMDRTIMIGAAFALTLGLATLSVISSAMTLDRTYWHVLLVAWFLLGIAYSMAVTPSACLNVPQQQMIALPCSLPNSHLVMCAG